MEKERGFPIQTDEEREDDNPHFGAEPIMEDSKASLTPQRQRKPKFPNTPEWQALRKKLDPPKSEHDDKKTA